MTWRDRAFVALQYLLPQHTISALVNRATRWRWKPWKNLLIRWGVRQFKIDLIEAAEPNPQAYASFNEFFTRALKPGARVLAPGADTLIAPADGVVSQFGAINEERLLQAKGRAFNLEELLTDKVPWQEHRNGQFATIYLSPRDYHRVHMPATGTLLYSVYVPGRLFSVAPATTAAIPRLFARNERFVCWFATAAGTFSLVLVGAVCVSAMDCVWAGPVAPGRGLRVVDHRGDGITLERGAEMGRFNMGSTVIMTLPAESVQWKQNLAPGVFVSMGQAIGRTT